MMECKDQTINFKSKRVSMNVKSKNNIIIMSFAFIFVSCDKTTMYTVSNYSFENF